MSINKVTPKNPFEEEGEENNAKPGHKHSDSTSLPPLLIKKNLLGLPGAGNQRNTQVIPLDKVEEIKQEFDADHQKIMIAGHREDNHPHGELKIQQNYEQKSKILNVVRMLALVVTDFYNGYYIIIANVLAPALTEIIFALPEDERKPIAGRFGFFFAIGCIFSSLLTGFLVRLFGRVRFMIMLQISCILLCFLYTVKNLTVFMIARGVSGFLGGLGLSLVPMTINEMMPVSLRGYGGSMSFTMVCLFLVVGSLQNPLFGGKEGLAENWKLVLAWPTAISVISLVVILLTFRGIESPHYYYDKFGDSPILLNKKILNFAKAIYTQESAQKFTNDFIGEKQRISEQQQQQSGNKSKSKAGVLRLLLGPKYRKQFFLCCCLNVLQQLTGNNFMLIFSTQIFDEISGNGAFMTMVLAFGMLAGAATSIFVINEGRKPGMLYPTILNALTVLALIFAIRYQNGLVASIAMFLNVWSFTIGFASIFTVFVVETLPSIGAGISFSFHWVTTATLGIIGAPMLGIFGIEIIFSFFFVCTIVACFVIHFVCRETAGKSEEDIARSYEMIGTKIDKEAL